MYYILDTETTGSSSSDQVIELAWLKVADNVQTLEVVAEFVERYNPSVPISDIAFQVHGISKRQLMRARCKPSSSIELPKDMLYLIAHNASFDARLLEQTIGKPLMHRELAGNGQTWVTHVKIIDTIKLIKALEKIQGGKFGFADYKLETIFSHWHPEQKDWQNQNAHSALGDCKMLRAVLLKSLQCFPHVESLESLFKLAKLV